MPNGTGLNHSMTPPLGILARSEFTLSGVNYFFRSLTIISTYQRQLLLIPPAAAQSAAAGARR
jgi:hypothetical protein